MAADQDTEITLGTGRMMALFFGLVAICAVFFAFGFSLGRNYGKGETSPGTVSAAPEAGSGKPALNKAAKNGNSATAPSGDELTFYKSVEQNGTTAPLAAGATAAASSSAPGNPLPATGASQPPPEVVGAVPDRGYIVQVAAVSKQEDAEALVAALRQKNYAVFTTTNPPADKLFHVQIGPFSELKDAEGVRAKLVGDGYNPIVKK